MFINLIVRGGIKTAITSIPIMNHLSYLLDISPDDSLICPKLQKVPYFTSRTNKTIMSYSYREFTVLYLSVPLNADVFILVNRILRGLYPILQIIV
jgi:hypothetical protein